MKIVDFLVREERPWVVEEMGFVNILISTEHGDKAVREIFLGGGC